MKFTFAMILESEEADTLEDAIRIFREAIEQEISPNAGEGTLRHPECDDWGWVHNSKGQNIGQWHINAA